MVRDPLFDSAWLKWGRAVVHMQTLEADIEALGPDGDRQPTIGFRTEYHPKRHGFGVYVARIDPIPTNWGLLLGDIANNLRSCLDQTAWALVIRGSTPPEMLTKKQRRAITFPIKKERDEFNDSLGSQLPGARRADIAIVRRYQPYKRGTRKARWAAWVLLADVNAADKHRTVQPVFAFPMAAGIEVADSRDCVIPHRRARGKRKPLEIDAELAFMRARKTGPNPQAEVKAHVTARPSFVGLVRMRDWLRESRQWTASFLTEFSEPPPEINDLGINWNAPA